MSDEHVDVGAYALGRSRLELDYLSSPSRAVNRPIFRRSPA